VGIGFDRCSPMGLGRLVEQLQRYLIQATCGFNESAILGLTLENVSLLDHHEPTSVLSSDHS